MADEPEQPDEQAEDQAWDRQQGETAKAFAAFTAYRDMPANERSLPKAATIFYDVEVGQGSGKIRQFEKWSTANGWTDRAAAYDDYLDATRQRTHAEEVEAMAIRHAEAGAKAVEKGLAKLEQMQVVDMSVGEAVAAIKIGVAVERLSRGEPETTGAIEHTGIEQDAARSLLTSNPAVAAAAAELAAMAAHEEAEKRGEKSNVSAIRRRTSKAPKEKVSAR